MNEWRLIVGAVLLTCAGFALAGGRGEVRKQTELSMLLSGTIDIDREGRVQRYVLEDTDKLPNVAAKVMDSASREWRFEPVVIDGKPVMARTAMSIRLVARPREGTDQFNVHIASANFGEPAPGEWVSSSAPLKPPRYPELAAMSGVSGTVYVIVRIGRDGKVEDALAEQVNLRVVDSEGAMERWRGMLARASLRTARQWTFLVPTKGEEVDSPFWLARVPIDYQLPHEKTPEAGRWEAYIPGPRQSAPWLGGIDTSLGADAVASGGISPLNGGPRLLTPLNEG